MRAAMYHGLRDIRVEEIDLPRAGPHDVTVRVAYNGLCGTDLHEYFDGPLAVPMQPHPLTGASAPLVLGHEAAGTVVEVGAAVTDVAVGELVAIEPLRSCGTCSQCSVGSYNLCPQRAFHGLSTGGGGLAEFTSVPRSMVHQLPAVTDPRAAALVEPLAVAHHAVGRSGVTRSQTAVVHGAGPIGIGIFLTLRHAGVQTVVVEPSRVRRAVVEGLGGQTIDSGDDSSTVADRVRDTTGGRGADVSYDAAGGPATFRSAVSTTARHGTVMVVASPRQPAASPVLSELLAGEIDVRTSYAYCGDFPTVIAKLSEGAYPLDDWVTTKPMTDLLKALELLRAGELIKVLIDPAC